MSVPIAGKWARRNDKPRCALYGIAVDDRQAVRLTAQGVRNPLNFCCLSCADQWIRRSTNIPIRIEATDEATGQPLDLTNAFVVQSRVVTSPVTGNSWHVFADRQNAMAHIETYGGSLLMEPGPLDRIAGFTRRPGQ